jgi:hypothetical protein
MTLQSNEYVGQPLMRGQSPLLGRWRLWSSDRFGWQAISVLALLVLALIPFLYYQPQYLPNVSLAFAEDPIGALGMAATLWQNHFLGVDGSSSASWLFPYGVTLASLSLLGLPAWLCQHVWAMLELFGAGIGMYLLSGEVLPEAALLSRFLAALSYQYSAYFLDIFPSSGLGWISEYMLLPYALWLVAHGIRRADHQIRCAVILGFVIGLPGPANVVPWAINILAIVLFVLHKIAINETTPMRLLRPISITIGVAFVAMLWWFLPMVHGALLNRSYVQGSLGAETLAMTNQSSSVFNAFRLATDWALHSEFNGEPYYRFGPWFTSNLVANLAGFTLVLATFLPLATRYARRYSYFAVMAVIGLAMMVGAYPLDRPNLQGQIYLWAYHHIPLFAVFRGGNKFAILPSLAIAVGVGTSYIWLARRIVTIAEARPLLRQSLLRPAAAVLAAAPLLLSVMAVAQPLWRGQLYQPSTVVSSIPTYWLNVKEYLDDQHIRSGVYVLPNQYFPVYQWGRPSTDVLDDWSKSYAYVSEYASLASYGSAGLGPLFDAVSSLRPDRLSELLQALGIQYVINRYDIDTNYYPNTVKPSAITALLEDTPGLRRVRRFGPVEIYRFDDALPFLAYSTPPSLVLNGTTTNTLIALSKLSRSSLPRLVIASPPRPDSNGHSRGLDVAQPGLYHLTVLVSTGGISPAHLRIDRLQFSEKARGTGKQIAYGNAYLRAGAHTVDVQWADNRGRPARSSDWTLIATPVHSGTERVVPINTQSWNNAMLAVRILASPTQGQIVTLNQGFNEGWQLIPLQGWATLGSLLEAIVKPRSDNHFELNGFANAWMVPPHQTNFLLVYTPEITFVLGMAVSFGSLATALVLSLYRRHRRIDGSTRKVTSRRSPSD